MNTKTDGPPWVSRCHGMKAPPGSAGVPPAQVLAQPLPSPPPGSTGSGARVLLRPGPCGSRRQHGRSPHRRETERQPKGQHAGGTPALPGGVVPTVRWEDVWRATSLKADGRPLGKPRLPASPAPAPRRGRSIEKDHQVNIDAQDAQDAQDNQGGRLLHERMTPAMIACGFADVQE